MVRTLKNLFLALIITSGVFAQAKQDSVKQYELDEITVKSGLPIAPNTITTISPVQIKNSDANSIFELSRLIPSVKTQNNSRGESLIYFRGSSKRQLLVYFDGIPLNIPWDNRIDLSLVPVNAVDNLSVTKGIPSVTYGANTPAGVVNVNTKVYRGVDEGAINVAFGQDSYKKIAGSYLGGNEKISWFLSASYKDVDEYTLPESYSNPNYPGDTRINSYQSMFNTFGKLAYNYGEGSRAELSLSFIDSEKGTTPEDDVDDPRFWQYPEWQKFTASFKGSNALDKAKSSVLGYSLSFTKFFSRIDKFTDKTYSDIDNVEKGTDNTFYTRAIYTKFIGSSSILKFAGSLSHTSHREEIKNDGYVPQDYSQVLYSVGTEYEHLGEKLTSIIGISADGMSTPETAGKPSLDHTVDFGIKAGFVYKLGDMYSLQLNTGRKTRFAALREVYSTALDRFEANPGLKPEKVYSADLGIIYKLSNFSAEATLFTNYITDGIVRISLPNTMLKRVNEDEILTYGLELSTNVEITDKMFGAFNFTVMESKAKGDGGEFSDTLEYKPSVLASVSIGYDVIKSLRISLEGYYTGIEYGVQQGSEYYAKLPDYFVLNSRLSYKVKFSESFHPEFFVRINNIFDRLYYTQWGLPEAGRQFSSGLNLNF